MSNQHFIAGDWGTSQLRLYLCKHQANKPLDIVATQFGLGVSKVEGNFEEVLFNACEAWLADYGNMPIILSGMIGSTIGWRDAGYLNCPLPVDDIIDGGTQFSARDIDISIVSGLRVDGLLGSPDVMRGEELQILGWKQLSKESNPTQLIALPGTHNKWTLVKDGSVNTFLTALTGELFAVLKDHSVLVNGLEKPAFNKTAFMEGLAITQQQQDSHLLHALFSTRSRQVVGGYSNADGLSYLSGLLVGADVAGALKLFTPHVDDINQVTLIGEGALCDYYQFALEQYNINVVRTNSQDVAAAAYAAVYQKLYC